MAQLFRALSLNPARLLGLPAGRLSVGAPADLVLFDPATITDRATTGVTFDLGALTATMGVALMTTLIVLVVLLVQYLVSRNPPPKPPQERPFERNL